MRRRADTVAQTRQRITEAAIRLHTTVGPSRSSVASIAEEAGVTRLTLYRHFPDLDSLFAACFGHWTAENPGPDAGAWSSIPDFEARITVALAELYAWFGKHGNELFPIYRDMAAMPMSTQAAMDRQEAALADALVAGREAGHPAGGKLRALAGHLVGFWTWRSLARDQGLGDEDAADLAVRLLLLVAGDRRRA
jgi:AcrR family transcriptional regulator